MRIACLHLPDFPLAALLRAEPELRGQSVVVADGPSPRARVLAVSPAAARRGLAPGLTAAQAHAVDDAVLVRTVSDDVRRATQAALGDIADSFSPRVEDASEGLVYLDADGLSALFPSESALASALAQRAVHLGLEAHVGLAGTKVAAYLAARDGGGVTVIPRGEEWRYLGPMPLGLLQPSAALAATLRRWGLHTIGDLAALPASAVGARLGPEGLALVRRARGEDEHPLTPRPAPLRFEEGMEIDYAIDTLEPLAFVARALLDRLTARLAVRGYVCGDLHCSLRLANRARDERTIPVAAPSNDVKSLLALLRLHLEAHPPAAGVEALRLAAVTERLRATQLDLFLPPGPAPERLAVTLARLTAVCGADRVGAPAVADSHRPDAYGVKQVVRLLGCYAVRKDESLTTNNLATNNLSALAIRALRPPRAVEVFCDRGRPDFVRGEGLSGRVVTAAGPWRVQTDWWNEQAATRDYYDIQLTDGGVYRMYWEREGGGWFVDGRYD
jgi:protein ImuB